MKNIQAPVRLVGSRRRGVALIEALVALLVMSFGMVALVGLLGNMRRGADLAKQRGEAVRLAEQRIEELRSFTTLTTPPTGSAAGTTGFTSGIPSGVTTQPDVLPADLTTNTTYSITTTAADVTDAAAPQVVPAVAPQLKKVTVQVAWTDRTGAQQNITFHSQIVGAIPALSGSASIAPSYTATQRPPTGASTPPITPRNLGDGRSVVVPVVGGTTAYVFNNLSGVITSRCTITAGVRVDQLTADSLTLDNGCTATYGLALWGFVRFADASSLSLANLSASMAASYARPLTMTIGPANSAAPAPEFTCYSNAPAAAGDGAALHQTNVGYFCVVTAVATQVTTQTEITQSTTPRNSTTTTITLITTYGGTVIDSHVLSTSTRSGLRGTVGTTSTSVTSNAWFGQLQVAGITPLGTSAGSNICRYSADYDGDSIISNVEHPLTYWNATGSLGNQNFLVINGAQTCPAGDPTTTGATFFSTATVLHQPNGIDTPTSH